MRIPQTYIQKSKAGCHFAQAFLIFIAGCLALAVLTKDGETGGQVGYYFALCFLSIPALLYQVVVPMWTRAWRFANVYAYASIDILFAILWLAAAIAVGVWESEGVDKGAEGSDKDGAGSCAQFAYGSEAKCSTSKASVGFGVVIFLLFALTSAMSVHGVLQFRKTGVMPSGDSSKRGRREQLEVEDPNKDAWSTNTDEFDQSHPTSYPPEGGSDQRRAYGQVPTEDEDNHHGLLNRPSFQRPDEDPFQDTHSMTEDGVHPGRSITPRSNSSLSIAPPPSHHSERPQQNHGSVDLNYVAPSALSPTSYEGTPGGRISFPNANYGASFR